MCGSGLDEVDELKSLSLLILIKLQYRYISYYSIMCLYPNLYCSNRRCNSCNNIGCKL